MSKHSLTTVDINQLETGLTQQFAAYHHTPSDTRLLAKICNMIKKIILHDDFELLHECQHSYHQMHRFWLSRYHAQRTI